MHSFVVGISLKLIISTFCLAHMHSKSDHGLWSNDLSSGDTDSVVPLTATRYSLDALKLPTITNWYPWYDNKKVSLLDYFTES